MSGLLALEARVAADLEILGHDAPDWVRPRGQCYDVVIVGGGQSGLGAAFALMRERIANILVIDENPAGSEGPWDTYARMMTLRTPKDLLSIDLGIPSLAFRSWWEAQHGAQGWDGLDKIPREAWMAYLRWYRRVLNLPVENETRLERIEPRADATHRLHLAGPAGRRAIDARKVVLATGIQGGGEWHVPGFVRAALPRQRYAHTSEAIDYAAMKGARVGILGAGASAFDNAHHALAEGVAAAHVFVRRPELPSVNPIRFMERQGVTGRFAALDDAAKYAIMASFIDRGQPPTSDMFNRCAAWPGFRLHLGTPWQAVRETAYGVVVSTPNGTFTFDFLVLSTGLVTDAALRPELDGLADQIARWGDRYHVPVPHPVIDAHPYLGSGFQLLPKRPESAARLHGLFAFNYSALVSLGLSAAALSGLKYALPRLVEGVANQLFNDDRDAMLAAYLAYDEAEFIGALPPDRVAGTA